MAYKTMVEIIELSDSLMKLHKNDLNSHQKYFEEYIKGMHTSEKLTTEEMNLAKAHIISKCCNYGR